METLKHIALQALRFRTLAVVLVVLFRLIHFNGNPEGFAVIGSDFVAETDAHAVTSEQGYDGQFFFAYAHAPLSNQEVINAIRIDHPRYRAQRFGYPLLTYMLSFLGNPILVPWILILLNVLAFVALIRVWDQLIDSFHADPLWKWVTVVLSGLWMALGRDLAELFEALFVLLALRALLQERIIAFVVWSLAAIVFRETGILLLLPASVLWSIGQRNQPGWGSRIFVVVVPVLAVMLLKGAMGIHYAAYPEVDGSQNVGLPFFGIASGFMANLPAGGIKEWAEFLLWIGYFLFAIALTVIIVQTLPFRNSLQACKAHWMGYTYAMWGLFALCLGPAIYVDDWGFVRIFTAWQLIGFLYLIQLRKPFPKHLISFAFFLTFTLVSRLILRP